MVTEYMTMSVSWLRFVRLYVSSLSRYVFVL